MHDDSHPKLTALAQLVELLGDVEGLTGTAELSERTGYTTRAIRKAKAELRFRNPSSGAEPQFREGGTQVPEGGTIVPTKAEPECRQASRARAYKETPSELVISSSLSLANARDGGEEIAGLNGSTGMYIDLVPNQLSPYAPDHETARSLLTGFVDTYGPDRVAVGLLELKTQIAAGNVPRNFAKAFPSFIRNASTTSRQEETAEKKSRLQDELAKWNAQTEEMAHG